MPFTVSHAIVAVPFRRTRIPAVAVAAGAVAPDAPLYFPGLPGYELTHDPVATLWTAVPLALLLVSVGLWVARRLA